MPISNKIARLYQELLQKHNSSQMIWPQWCAKKKNQKQRETIAIGAILVQRTNWHNAELALKNLRKKGMLSLKKIASLRKLEELKILIRPAGFGQTKSKKLFDFCFFIIKKYGSLEKFMKEDLEIARRKLLSLSGIGPETADTILLYAMDKPSFVIDEYTKRLIRRRKLARKFSYDHLKNLFEKNLPRKIKIYQKFHALIVEEEKSRTAFT